MTKARRDQGNRAVAGTSGNLSRSQVRDLVKCPACLAEPGQKCRRLNGNPRESNHFERWQRAQKPRGWNIEKAERIAAQNKALIEAGVTFAAHKPSDWHRGGKRQEPRR